MVSPSLHKKPTKSALLWVRVTPEDKQRILQWGGPNITEYIQKLIESDIRRKRRRANGY
jgi:hypothetical protein